jgi:hypothetical protein
MPDQSVSTNIYPLSEPLTAVQTHHAIFFAWVLFSAGLLLSSARLLGTIAHFLDKIAHG